MNITRLIGLIVLIAAIALYLTVENDLTDFLLGFLFAIGIILLITGKTIFNKRDKTKTT